MAIVSLMETIQYVSDGHRKTVEPTGSDGQHWLHGSGEGAVS